MARTGISSTRLSRVGVMALTPTTELDPVNGNYADNDGATLLHMENTAGAARDVTILIPTDVDMDLPVTSRTYTLSAGQIGLVGLFPRETYGGQLLVDVDGADVMVIAVSVRQ
jgi:hypothetical protein